MSKHDDDADERFAVQRMNAEAWVELPDPLRRVGASLARYRKFEKMQTPEIIKMRERELLAQRLTELRTYLDVLDIELAQPND